MYISNITRNIYSKQGSTLTKTSSRLPPSLGLILTGAHVGSGRAVKWLKLTGGLKDGIGTYWG